MSYYFSTHGCSRVVSCFDVKDEVALEEAALAAAAAWRALMSKKLDMTRSDFGTDARVVSDNGQDRSRMELSDMSLERNA